MSDFKPKKHHLREVLLYFFSVKKSAAESHRLLVEAYGEAALPERTSHYWFRRFKSGDFDVEDKERARRAKLVKDAELEALLDEDPCQTQEELAKSLGIAQSTIFMRLKALGMIQKQGNWVPYELKPRDLERRLLTCEQLLQRQKRNDFLHRIITGDEKWIYYDNPKRKNHGISPTMHQHPQQSRTSMFPSLCSVFGGISRVSCTTSCFNLTKPLQRIDIDFN